MSLTKGCLGMCRLFLSKSRIIATLAFLISTLNISLAQSSKDWFLSEKFENVPESGSMVIGEGIISTDSIEYNTSLSSVYSEFYFTKNSSDFSNGAIHVSHYRDGEFSTPEKLKLGGEYYKSGDVHIQANGEYLYFNHNNDIWRSKRSGEQWSSPAPLSGAINTVEGGEYYCTTSSSGNLYFCRSGDIYFANKLGQDFERAKPIDILNTEYFEGDAWIAPDESYIIFIRMRVPGDLGVSDMYISINDNGVWQEAKHMGEKYNSVGVDGSPFVSPDGKFLFFTSNRDSKNPNNFDGRLDIYVTRFNMADWL